MGACATKPKADATDAPPPLPEKEELQHKELSVASTVVETKEVVDADKSRSLSNLFKQNEQAKGSTENDMIQTEIVKKEACEAEENSDISKTKPTEVVESEISRETLTPTVVAAVVEAEKAHEVEASTDKFEISVENTVIPTADAPAMVKVKESIEVETANEETETLKEEIPISYAPVDVEADKEIEVASATENQETVAIVDIKIDEHDKGIETPKSESVVESASIETEFVEDKTSSPVVHAHVEADKKTEVAANEIQIAGAVEEVKVEEHDEVVETQKPKSPEKIAEESEQTTEFEKPEILLEKEVQDSKIDEEKAVTESQKALEEKTAETEVCAETVKP